MEIQLLMVGILWSWSIFEIDGTMHCDEKEYHTPEEALAQARAYWWALHETNITAPTVNYIGQA